MRIFNRSLALIVALLFVPVSDVRAQMPRRPAVETHECFLHDTTCGSTVNDEITIFGCRYDGPTQTQYWTRYRFRVGTQSTITVTVTSTEFIPEIGLSESNSDHYLAYNSNSSRQNTINLTTTGSARSYDVDIYAKSLDTGRFTLKVTCGACPAPTITHQPTLTTVPYGGSATLTAEATGMDPLLYAWYDIVDPATAIAVGKQFHTPALTQPATYFVEVSTSCGSKTRSRNVIVQPEACNPPVVTEVARSLAGPFGTPLNLEVRATGSAPFTYQWYEGLPGDTSRPVVGATDSRLQLFATRSASYWARVTNACRSTDSREFTITPIGKAKRRSTRH